MRRMWGEDVAHILEQIGRIMISIGPAAMIASQGLNGDVSGSWGQWTKNAYARDKMVKGAIAYLTRLLPSADALAAAAPPTTAPEVDQVCDLIIEADEPEKKG